MCEQYLIAKQRLEAAQARVLELMVFTDKDRALWASDKFTNALEELRDAKLVFDAATERLTPAQRKLLSIRMAHEFPTDNRREST